MHQNCWFWCFGPSPFTSCHSPQWKFSMAPHGKELSQDLRNRVVSQDLRNRVVSHHKDGLGYKKIGNRLNLSPNTVARIIQRFSKTGSTGNRPRQGRSKKLNPRYRRQVQRLASQNRRRSAAGIAVEIADMGGQSVKVNSKRTGTLTQYNSPYNRMKPS